MCVGAVAGCASRNALRCYSVHVDIPPAGDFGRVSHLLEFHLLARIILCQGIDSVVRQWTGHAPHITDGVRITASLASEVLELGDQVVGILARQTRELRLRAVPLSAMT